jgi:myo-inositol-1(or 4)-monophosphatase
LQVPQKTLNKPDISIVTEADLLIENYFRSQIRKYYPEHTIIGEEMEAEKGHQYTWIIDPIDGSAPFLWNIPIWCISIGITKEKQPFMGLVYVPLTGDFYYSDNSLSYLTEIKSG